MATIAANPSFPYDVPVGFPERFSVLLKPNCFSCGPRSPTCVLGYPFCQALLHFSISIRARTREGRSRQQGDPRGSEGGHMPGNGVVDTSGRGDLWQVGWTGQGGPKAPKHFYQRLSQNLEVSQPCFESY